METDTNKTIINNIIKTQNPKTEDDFYKMISEILEYQTMQLNILLAELQAIKQMNTLKPEGLYKILKGIEEELK